MGAVMFTVNRDQFGAALPDGLHYQFTAGNQNFLIGESHTLPRANCLKRRFQPTTPTMAETTVSTSELAAAATRLRFHS
jgi:hypothetical protein